MNSALAIRVGSAAVLLLLFSVSPRAEVTLLKADPSRSDIIGRINFRVGGSIRPEVQDVMGSKDKGSFKRDLFDGGTRFRFHLRYRLDDDLNVIGFSEVGVNIPALIGWHGHYAKGARHTGNRQLYGGFRSKRWGELTYGHRHSIYYDTISAKTDIWGNDLHAEPVALGIDQNYDGSWNALRSLNYVQHVGPADLYASYLLAEHPLYKGEVRYKRHSGQSLGIDYHFTPDLSWGLAWSMTNATVYNAQQQARFHQQLLGSGFSWTPGHWTLAATGGWYRHFVPLQGRPVHRYFANRAWGMSYFVARNFPVHRYGLEGVMPYYFGVQVRAGDHHARYQRENGLAVALLLYKGFRLDYQHVFRSSNDHMGDLNFVRLRYDF